MLRALSDNPVYPIDDDNLHAETAAVYVERRRAHSFTRRRRILHHLD
ncbi:MAG: hypothetical protein R2748_02225 [Bryobacterales bacterium]